MFNKTFLGPIIMDLDLIMPYAKSNSGPIEFDKFTMYNRN
jgi:hypothetical protein